MVIVCVKPKCKERALFYFTSYVTKLDTIKRDHCGYALNLSSCEKKALKKLALNANMLNTIEKTQMIDMMNSRFHVTKVDKFRVSMVRFAGKFSRVTKIKVKNT